MSLAIYTSAAWTANGGLQVADNATIEVRRESDGALATIYSDREGEEPITNPSAFGDEFGRFQFFAGDGEYRVKVSQDGNEYTLRYQSVGDVSRHATKTGGVHGIPEDERAIHSEELLAAVSTATTTAEAVSMVGKGAIVESDTNENGSYVRWENGEQFWWIRRAELTGMDGSAHDQDFTLPAALATTDGAMAVGTLERTTGRWDSGEDRESFITITPRDTNVGVFILKESDFVGDFGEIHLFGTGFWK